MCRLKTESLARHIIEYMKALIELLPTHTRNLALLVRLVYIYVPNAYHTFILIQRRYICCEEGCSVAKQFHQTYKAWVLQEKYEDMAEDDWIILLEEDSPHPYDEYPLSKPPNPVSSPISPVISQEDTTEQSALDL